MNQSGVQSSTIKDILPQSSQQIHLLKKQILKQAYDQQAINRSPRLRVNPETREKQESQYNKGSIRSSRSVQLLPTYRTKQDHSIRNMLKDSYEQDIRLKQRQRQQQRQILRNERDSLNELYKSQNGNPYYDRIKRQQEEYAKVLDMEIKQKQMKRQLQKQQDRKEVHDLEIKRQQRNMGPIQKEKSFKQYFNTVNQYRDSVANDYLKYLNQSPKKNYAKVNDDREIMEQQRKVLESQYHQQIKKNESRKKQLKTVLEQQIMENRIFKASQKHQYMNKGYVRNQSNVYNPISNPIDYQLDINNKYVVKEIIRKQLDGSRINQ